MLFALNERTLCYLIRTVEKKKGKKSRQKIEAKTFMTMTNKHMHTRTYVDNED